MSNSPIADLSYRHYDGPLNAPVARWWSIARMTMQVATKKRGFWGWSIFSAWWYIILLAVFWFMENVMGAMSPAGGQNLFLSQIIWKDQFLHAFGFSQMILLVIALLVGTSSIATDNRSNALLIYLSKPCSKYDYVFGKWLGVFLLIFGVAVTPMMFFYLYGVLSFQSYGFWTSSPWLFLRLIGVAAMAGALHASLSIGISSLFNQARIAGATYSGIYFITNIFTQIMTGINVIAASKGSGPASIVKQLFYTSIDGIQIGMAKNIIGTNGSRWFPIMQNNGPKRNPNMNIEELIIGAPNLSWILPLYLFICVAGFAIAWSRVKAVEVVG